MSPGSSSHSSLGHEVGAASSAARRRAGAASRARPIAPAPAALRLQQEDVVGIDVRADAAAVARVRAHHVVEAGVGDEAKAPQQAMRRSSCRSTPWTSRVQPASRSAGSARRANGPWRSRQRAPSRDDQPRLDVVARGQREQPRRGRCRGSAPGTRRAPASGFFCQWRRMNSAGDRPPSRAIGRRGSMPHCAMIIRWKSPRPASSA